MADKAVDEDTKAKSKSTYRGVRSSSSLSRRNSAKKSPIPKKDKKKIKSSRKEKSKTRNRRSKESSKKSPSQETIETSRRQDAKRTPDTSARSREITEEGFSQLSTSPSKTISPSAEPTPPIPKVSVESIMMPTVFENIQQPFMIMEKHREMRWKEGYTAVSTKQSKNAVPLTVENLSSDAYRPAVKALIYAKDNDLMENLLTAEGNTRVKSYLSGGMKTDAEASNGLIAAAMNSLHKKLINAEVCSEAEVKHFLNDPLKAQNVLFDLILFIPDLFPDTWGGRDVGMKTSSSGDAASKKYQDIYTNEKLSVSKSSFEKAKNGGMPLPTAGTSFECVNDPKSKRAGAMSQELYQ